MRLSKTHLDSRLEQISNLLIQYSLGNFEAQLPLSNQGDDIDAIIAGVNMLGEELQHVTISRDFLSRVYNSIAEMLFVTDLNGNIEEVNTQACEQLKLSKNELGGLNLFDFLQLWGTEKIDLQSFEKTREKAVFEGVLKKNTDVKLKCTFTLLEDANGMPSGILCIVEDITNKVATEKLLIRTIVDTQEKERNRFASDLHDSLGQQLSGIRFYISAIQSNQAEDSALYKQLNKSLTVIDSAITELRSICFNLMPRTLENHTLRYSLEELASQFSMNNQMKFNIAYPDNIPKLQKNFEIACFRIIQEFLNNAIKHGKASDVRVKFSLDLSHSQLSVSLRDNGTGFDLSNPKFTYGMGLRNIKTRVESYYGQFKIEPEIEKGTKMTMHFPLTFITLHL